MRESHLVVETLERIRVDLPFALLALDVDNGREFVNERLIEYCLSLGIELTRSHPYRKNDQAWIEQKNGAVMRKLLAVADSQSVPPSAQRLVPVAMLPGPPQMIYAGSGKGRFHVLTMLWPLVCRRLEGFPNVNSSQLFEELCVQFPGRCNPYQWKNLSKRMKICAGMLAPAA